MVDFVGYGKKAVEKRKQLAENFANKIIYTIPGIANQASKDGRVDFFITYYTMDNNWYFDDTVVLVKEWVATQPGLKVYVDYDQVIQLRGRFVFDDYKYYDTFT